MLKFVCLVLVVANAAVFAFQQGYLGRSDGHEPMRISAQLNPDKLILTSASAVNATIALAVNGGTSNNSLDKKTERIACLEIASFAQPDANNFEKLLAPLALGERLQRREVKEAASHMVYIPPQLGKEGADKKADQLRKAGVTNFFIIQENSNLKWGISLGVFKTKEAAQNYLNNLNKQGVHSARIGERSVTMNKSVFQIRDIDPGTKLRLEKITAEFSGQEIRQCE